MTKRAEFKSNPTVSFYDPLNEIVSNYTREVALRTDAILSEILAGKGLVLEDAQRYLKKTRSTLGLPDIERFWHGDECILEVTQTFEDNVLKATWNTGE
ncbi:MAG: hypothetical protein ACYSW7_12220 [Planctomycetota bacterium]|jgi:hypothetical protein